MNVHLVDGTYELFRAYYGAPASASPHGVEVGATRGLLRSMLSLLRQPDVTHVAAAFDHVIESFRNDLFPGYKTGEGIDELFERIVRDVPAPAGLAAQLAEAGPDRDSHQVEIGNKVVKVLSFSGPQGLDQLKAYPTPA